MPEFIARAAVAVEAVSPGARVVCFGHMGDGNLHYNISQPAGADPKAFLALYRNMNKAVHDIVRDLDGSISAEHGIGQLKRDELLATAPPVGIDLMRRVKAAFDPARNHEPRKSDLSRRCCKRSLTEPYSRSDSDNHAGDQQNLTDFFKRAGRGAALLSSPQARPGKPVRENREKPALRRDRKAP